jgi:hypothetical protein
MWCMVICPMSIRGVSVAIMRAGGGRADFLKAREPRRLHHVGFACELCPVEASGDGEQVPDHAAG